mmetsp:Transcript_70128/g.177320  ORF Transcript_70128/g.177320 Transcript_70128/m.177320 type:complete len:104 (-) Transcript_70128:85-396(-)
MGGVFILREGPTAAAPPPDPPAPGSQAIVALLHRSSKTCHAYAVRTSTGTLCIAWYLRVGGGPNSLRACQGGSAEVACAGVERHLWDAGAPCRFGEDCGVESV